MEKMRSEATAVHRMGPARFRARMLDQGRSGQTEGGGALPMVMNAAMGCKVGKPSSQIPFDYKKVILVSGEWENVFLQPGDISLVSF